MPQFPKRLDKLAENELYGIDSIEVSKRVSDEEVGVKKVSYIVTATYDLLTNLTKRGSGGGGVDNDDEEEGPTLNVVVDQDGKKLTKDTPPWKLKPNWTITPIEVTVPFLKSVADFGETPENIVNAAGDRMEATTTIYRFEISYSQNYETTQSEWDLLDNPIVNSEDVSFIPGLRIYKAGGLLLIPPTLQKNWWEYEYEEKKPDGSTETKKAVQRYYTYTVKMIYDKRGWKKTLLNVGTRAKFEKDVPEQIYQLTVQAKDGSIADVYPKYTNIVEVINEKRKAETSKALVSAVAVNQQLPLDDNGKVFEAAIKDPVNNPYKELEFKQYLEESFENLPFYHDLD